MRGLLTTVLAVAVSVSPVTAQEQTLVGHGSESGGFGAPVVKFTQENGEFGVMVGGRGGWIINHRFVLGGGGYGLVNDSWVNGVPLGSQLQFGYGGLELEGIIASNSIVHFTVSSLVGGGGVTFGLTQSDAVFVLEPQATVELNITSFMRMNVGAGYRWVTDVDLYPFTNGDFSAAFGSLALKFGKF